MHREDIETSVSQKPYPMPAPPRPGDDSMLHEARMKVVREQMRQEYNEYKVCERALTSHSTNSTNVRYTNEMFAGA